MMLNEGMAPANPDPHKNFPFGAFELKEIPTRVDYKHGETDAQARRRAQRLEREQAEKDARRNN